ncbi:hypothetical protein AURDEDRAFT_115810 [Auricularia subglabra TFB-10046 SS5]|nr:hypothetical protein AURDEDRAFT_115810 [Auricularia subglabra TFB-10046 SS5]
MLKAYPDPEYMQSRILPEVPMTRRNRWHSFAAKAVAAAPSIPEARVAHEDLAQYIDVSGQFDIVVDPSVLLWDHVARSEPRYDWRCT